MNDKPWPLTYEQTLQNMYLVRNTLKRKKNSPDLEETIRLTDELIKILVCGRDDIE